MEKLLKLAHLEESLGVSRWTLYEWIKSGRLSAIRLRSGQYRVRQSVATKLLRDQGQGSRLGRNLGSKE